MKRSNEYSSGPSGQDTVHKKPRFNQQQQQQTMVQQNQFMFNQSQNTNPAMSFSQPAGQDMYNPYMGQFMGQYPQTVPNTLIGLPGIGSMNGMQFQPMGMGMGLGMSQFGANPAQFMNPTFTGHPEASTIRTLYFGNLPQNTTIEDICNQIKCGMIEHVKVIEDKNCAFVSFVDPACAQLFVSESGRNIIINGNSVRVGFGNKDTQIASDVIAAIAVGASRNVFVGNIDDKVDEEYLTRELSRFGQIDQIKLLTDKHYAFVHMASIGAAVKAVQTLPNDTNWSGRKLGYGKDRCAVQAKAASNVSGSVGVIGSAPQGLPLQTPNLMFGGASGMGYTMGVGFPMNGFDFSGVPVNRTIYIGNLPSEITLKELCDAIRGGILEKIKFSPDKKCAFATFVDPQCAAAFLARGNNPDEGFVVKARRLRVNYGRPSPINTTIQQAVLAGASRNVYIGNIDANITQQRLLNDFSQFGDIELVNIVQEKNAAFVNFTDIQSAMQAVEIMRTKEEYQQYKINFGKDRCGQMPRQRNNSGMQNAGLGIQGGVIPGVGGMLPGGMGVHQGGIGGNQGQGGSGFSEDQYQVGVAGEMSGDIGDLGFHLGEDGEEVVHEF